MTKLHNDFLGPFVECNGSICRPAEKSKLLCAASVQASNIRYSPIIKVKDDLGNEEIWHSCGSAISYKEARNTLSQAEFEKFSALACGTAMSSRPQAPYPQVHKLFPKGYVDYSSKQFTEYLDQMKSLENAAYGRISARYSEMNPGSISASAKTSIPKVVGTNVIVGGLSVLQPSAMVATPAAANTIPTAPVSTRRRRP